MERVTFLCLFSARVCLFHPGGFYSSTYQLYMRLFDSCIQFFFRLFSFSFFRCTHGGILFRSFFLQV